METARHPKKRGSGQCGRWGNHGLASDIQNPRDSNPDAKLYLGPTLEGLMSNRIRKSTKHIDQVSRSTPILPEFRIDVFYVLLSGHCSGDHSPLFSYSKMVHSGDLYFRTSSSELVLRVRGRKKETVQRTQTYCIRRQSTIPGLSLPYLATQHMAMETTKP